MTAPRKTTQKRPSTARQTTRATKAKRDAALDQGFALTDPDTGVRLEVRIRDVKGTHDAALVAATGLDFMGLMEAITRRQGLDLFAAAIWFCRMVNNQENTGTYAATLDWMGYDTVAEMKFEEPADDSPEA